MDNVVALLESIGLEVENWLMRVRVWGVNPIEGERSYYVWNKD